MKISFMQEKILYPHKPARLPLSSPLKSSDKVFDGFYAISVTHVSNSPDSTQGILESDKRSAKEEELRQWKIAYKGGMGGLCANLAHCLSGLYPFPHEKGHMMVLSHLYKDVNPRIELVGYNKLVLLFKSPSLDNARAYLETTYGVNARTYCGGNAEIPTPLGNRFTPLQREALVAIAGPLIDGGIALALFAAGLKLRKKHSTFGNMAIGYSIGIQVKAAYALSPYFTNIGGNDFISIARGFQIPYLLVSLAGAFAIPAICAVLHLYEKHKNEKHIMNNALAFPSPIWYNIITFGQAKLLAMSKVV